MLPYDHFAVRLPERDVDDLKELLEGMPPAEVRALQQGVHRYHRYFFWQEPEGQAYDLVIKSLEARGGGGMHHGGLCFAAATPRR